MMKLNNIQKLYVVFMLLLISTFPSILLFNTYRSLEKRDKEYNSLNLALKAKNLDLIKSHSKNYISQNKYIEQPVISLASSFFKPFVKWKSESIQIQKQVTQINTESNKISLQQIDQLMIDSLISRKDSVSLAKRFAKVNFSDQHIRDVYLMYAIKAIPNAKTKIIETERCKVKMAKLIRQNNAKITDLERQIYSLNQDKTSKWSEYNEAREGSKTIALLAGTQGRDKTPFEESVYENFHEEANKAEGEARDIEKQIEDLEKMKNELENSNNINC